MVMFYVSAIIDLLQVETKQKCLAMQYRRHPLGWRYYFERLNLIVRANAHATPKRTAERMTNTTIPNCIRASLCTHKQQKISTRS